VLKWNLLFNLYGVIGMKINIGHAVVGDDFFGREKELKKMGRKLENKAASLLIPGPRRIGKTSLVREFIRRNNDRYKFIYLNLQGRHSIIEFCDDLKKEIEVTFPRLIKGKGNFSEKWNELAKAIPEISIGGVIKVKTGEKPIITKKIMKKMEEVFRELYANGFILAVDEFSDFLLTLKKSNHDEVELFLEWLRRLRQEERLRMIVTGSINIISTVEELLVPDLINDLIDIDIFPLKPEEIKTLLTELLKEEGVTFSDELMDFALTKLKDGVPFFIQLFAENISDRLSKKTFIDDIEEIKELYDEITGKQHKEMVDFHTRLETYLSETDFSASRKILANAAFKPITFDDIYSHVENILPDKRNVYRLLKRLEDECYLKKIDEYYQFVSPMVADWWKNNYGFER
jgi:AAA+ ATPase superfamily predicted ATPase